MKNSSIRYEISTMPSEVYDRSDVVEMEEEICEEKIVPTKVVPLLCIRKCKKYVPQQDQPELCECGREKNMHSENTPETNASKNH
jgi:hypothetical protein